MKLDIDPKKYIDIIKKHKNIIIVILFILIILTVLIYLFYNKIPRCIKNANNIYRHCNELRSIEKDPILMKNDYRLCDFFINSSYKSYLACPNNYYASVDALKMCLINGCRYLDLDIYNKDFTTQTQPVVCYGNEVGNWHYSNVLCFDECCKTIADYAFSNYISNNSDPLFINLNLFVNHNYYTIDKIHDILIKYFSHRILSSKYSYQDGNLPEISIKDLIHKVVFICDNYEDLKSSKLNEIVNISSRNNEKLRTYEYNKLFNIECKCKIDTTEELTEIKNFNKNHLTKIYNKDFKNYNFYLPWYLGIQFICMSYNHPTNYMVDYLNHFRVTSFVLKPYRLRKKTKYTPEKVKTPFYEIYY